MRAAVVAFAFGTPSTIRPNTRIASITARKARELQAPVYTQADIALEPGVETVQIDEKDGKPPPTLRIARGAARWAKARRLTELWVVAAKPHLWRAERDLREAVQEVGGGITIRVPDEIRNSPSHEWFCCDSEQERTRSASAWKKRECILRIMPFSLYKLIAG